MTGDGSTPDTVYNLTAVPESSGYTGLCSFSSNQSGTIEAKSGVAQTSVLQMGGEASGCGAAGK